MRAERKVIARGRGRLTRAGARRLGLSSNDAGMAVNWVQYEPAWEGADEIWSEGRRIGGHLSWVSSCGSSPGLVRS